VTHFTHIPFCGPNSIRALPEAVAQEYLGALESTPTGFHSNRWAQAYRASAAEVLGHAPKSPSFFVPLGPDRDALQATLAEPEAEPARAWLRDIVDDRTLIARTDRIEPTKNIVRGFDAYELLLETRPEWRGRVVFVACCYRSRSTIDSYRRYADAVEATAERINERFGNANWQPVVLDVRDDYRRSMVALEQADVTLVNSLKDGLNLVAMESPVINARNGVVVCSRDTGAYELIADGVLGVNPFDLCETAQALDAGLRLDSAARAALAATARDRASAHSPRTWLEGCLAHRST
jgi:trehalose 6-phosphate synthase